MQLKPLDIANLCYIWIKSYPALWKTWSNKGRNLSDGVLKVNYGFDNVPGPDEHVFGGMVKLQDLNREFPQSMRCPHILYLVSSALPYFPIRLAKHARKVGAKIVVNQNGVAYPGWFGKGWEKENRSMSILNSMADYVIYQSDFCKVSASEFLGERLGESEILYNPVDTSFFRPCTESDQSGIYMDLLLSGSHWTKYRVNSALETLKRVRENRINARLKIAGRFCWDDDAKQAEKDVTDYAESLGVLSHTNIVGSYTQEQAPKLLSSCSLLLHTKYNDPCPRLVVEAMACGLPIVYSATGGVSELVGDEAGIGVPGPLDWEHDHPPEPELLAEAVMKVLDNLNGFSQAARKRAVQKFDVQSWLKRHDKIFHKITEP